MLLIPIQAIPNQIFPVVLGNSLFNITLKTIAGMTYMSISINGTDVLDNARACANEPIIPSVYEENGNFMFLSPGYQLPYYPNFNTTQVLVYFTAAEIAAFRAAPRPVFNPIAALPIRYITAPNYADPLITTDTGLGIMTDSGISIAAAVTNENPTITTNLGQIVTDQNNNPLTT